MELRQSSEENKISAIEKYLGSGIIKGVGPSTAKKIVAHFGKNTEFTIENNCQELCAIKGISQAKAEIIEKSWKRNKGFNEVAMFLQEYGITIGMSVKIWQAYGKNASEIIKENPYRLSRDIVGVGFLSADKIALSIGVERDSEMRAIAGLEHILHEYTKSGSCCIHASDLIFKASEELHIENSILMSSLKENIKSGVFIAVDAVTNKRVVEFDFELQHHEENRVSTPVIFIAQYYHMERAVAKKFAALQSGKSMFATKIKEDEVFQWLSANHSVIMSDKQKEGISMAIQSKCLVITGGPGTGKTTMLSALLLILNKFLPNTVLRIKLAAPTGRAAKRMSESTGHSASTIHRLLEYDPVRGGFKYDAYNQLKCDIIVIDESSMIDLKLMYSLISALPSDCHLILVGDVDQLPSVGAGAILADVISSHTVPVVHLNQIFRQAATSDIVRNAHLINHGMMPKIATANDKKDCWFEDIANVDNVPSALIDIISQGLSKDVSGKNNNTGMFDTLHDVQVLAPMQKGVVGVKYLNLVLQKALNRNVLGGVRIEKYGVFYYVGDKVMQIENNYNKNIFNGDIGFIEKINLRSRTVMIAFDGRVIEYSFAELGQIVLAYAITIHKSQGAEYPVVIIPIVTQHYVMLNRNLIYTALTRAKKLAIFIGHKRALAISVNNLNTHVRHTMLSVWMKEML